MLLRKALFVDGASLSLIRRLIGLKNINHKRLYTLVLQEVGKARAYAGKPLLTCTPTMNPNFLKAIGSCGFEVGVASTEHGADDLLIKERIRSLNARSIDELCIITADQDFLSVISEKVDENPALVVYWIATRALHKDGKPVVGRVLEDLFETKPRTHQFIELARFKEHLALPDRKPGNRNPLSRTETSLKTARITFQIGNAKVTTDIVQTSTQLLDALAVIRKEIPSLSVELT